MKIDPEIDDMLRQCGLPWRVAPKRRHYVLIISEQPVLTFPRRGFHRGGHHDRGVMNSRATVRRFLRQAGVDA